MNSSLEEIFEGLQILPRKLICYDFCLPDQNLQSDTKILNSIFTISSYIQVNSHFRQKLSDIERFVKP